MGGIIGEAIKDVYDHIKSDDASTEDEFKEAKANAKAHLSNYIDAFPIGHGRLGEVWKARLFKEQASEIDSSKDEEELKSTVRNAELNIEASLRPEDLQLASLIDHVYEMELAEMLNKDQEYLNIQASKTSFWDVMWGMAKKLKGPQRKRHILSYFNVI